MWIAKDDSVERRGDAIIEEKNADRAEDGFSRIRCPKCDWRPRSSDRWQCTCLHVWNTFDTGGVCPDCGFRWHWTQCLRCHERSPHEDWYVVGEDPAGRGD